MAGFGLLLVAVSLEGGRCPFCGLVCCCWWFIVVLQASPALQVKQRIHGGLAVSKNTTQFPPSPVSGAENFTERNGLTSKLRTHGAAQELIVVEDPDLGHVSGIDSQGHHFANDSS